jgi:hypothetical protein
VSAPSTRVRSASARCSTDRRVESFLVLRHHAERVQRLGDRRVLAQRSALHLERRLGKPRALGLSPL